MWGINMAISLLKDLGTLKKQNLAVTIGNFDGVHLGHQSFLLKALSSSKSEGLTFVVVTFVPHPIFVLNPRSEFLINSYCERRHLLEQLGVEYLLEIDFTRDVSTMMPQQFLDGFISYSSLVKKIFLGHDFAFGANKSGGHEFVKEYCKERNINVEIEDKYEVQSELVSSSKIREYLKQGMVLAAHKFLGRPFFLSGRIIKGMGRGKKIGIPTANLGFDLSRMIPMSGVYITQTEVGGLKYKSVTNIGLNPTFGSENSIGVETHILDFNRDIYGEEVQVFFYEKIRDEIKFNCVNDLIAQIKSDIDCARKACNG